MRGYKTLANIAIKNSFKSTYYAKCERCKSISNKMDKHFFCVNCETIIDTSQTCDYVKCDLAKQIQMISKKVQINSTKDKDELCLELMITCDGIPLSKSSSVNLYPILIYIKNIENLNLRNQYYLVGSMGLAKRFESGDKLDPRLLLQPIVDQYKSIKNKPFRTDWHKRTTIQFIAFIADAPCRADFLEVSRFNAKNPCHRCHVKLSEKSILPMKYDDLKLKNLNLTIEYAKAYEKSCLANPRKKVDPAEGVKGVSLLKELSLDYMTCSPVEIMHCFFLGVAKRWMKQAIFGESRTYKARISEINRRISMIKLPSNSKRMLRSFDDLANFKSAEFELVAFYFGQFLFKGVFDTASYQMFHYLSSAVFKLYSRRTEDEQIKEAKAEIDNFMLSLKASGDKHNYTYNMHCMLHLCDDREKFGPLSLVNAYAYENQLQQLKKISKSRNIRLPSIMNKVMQDFFLDSSTESVVDPTGFVRTKLPSAFMQSLIQDRFPRVDLSQLSFFNCFRFHFLNIATFEYEGRKNNNDSFVKIDKKFFNILCIFSLSNVVYCVAEQLEMRRNLHPEIRLGRHRTDLIHTHIIKSVNTKQFDIFKVSRIERQVCYIKLDSSLSRLFDYTEYILEIEN